MNRYVRYYANAMPAIALLFAPAVSMAVDWSVSARAETGFQYYSYRQSPMIFNEKITDLDLTDLDLTVAGLGLDETGKRTGTGSLSTSNKDISATMPLLGGGLSVVIGRFFIDASIQGTFDGSDSDNGNSVYSAFSKESDIFADGDTFEYQVDNNQSYETDFDFDRTEYALSFGYAVTNSFAVYTGWKWAKTSFDLKEEGVVNDREYLQYKSPDGSEEDPIRITESFDYQGKLGYDFNQDGPFIGAAYSWLLNGPVKGTLTVNTALAFLYGEFDVKYTDVLEEADYSFEGDSTALTFGVSWRGETGVKGLSYLLGINGYSYTFEADSLKDESFNGSSGGDVTETVLNFKLGLAYRF